MEQVLYCTYLLAWNPVNNSYIMSEKRKIAIKSLLIDKKTQKPYSVSKGSITNGVTFIESLEPLDSIIKLKLSYIIENKLYLKESSPYTDKLINSLQMILLHISNLTSYMNMTIDPKKEIDKMIDLPPPREIEKRFKEIEEKEPFKVDKKPFYVTRKNLSHSNKLTSYCMNLIEKTVEDILVKPNSPFTSWKRARLFNIYRDKLGIRETQFDYFFYSHINDYDIYEWDYDILLTYHRNKADLYKKIQKSHEPATLLRRGEILDDFTNYESKKEEIKKIIIALFSSDSILIKHDKKVNLYLYEAKIPLEYINKTIIKIDDKNKVAPSSNISFYMTSLTIIIEKKLVETKPKKPIAVPIYVSNYVAIYDSQYGSKSSKQYNGTSGILRSGSGRPSSKHVDDFIKNQPVKVVSSGSSDIVPANVPQVPLENSRQSSLNIQTPPKLSEEFVPSAKVI